MNEQQITALTNLLNSSFVTTILGFVLGLGSQIILKKRNECKKNKENEQEFSIFKDMVSTDYIAPFHELLDQYSRSSDWKLYRDLKKYSENAEKRLNLLRRNEISYLKSDNQFKMVRLIEFTKTYFKESRRALEFYTFKPINATKEDYEKDKKIQQKNIEMLKISYEENKDDYMNLQTDNLFLVDDIITEL